MRGIEGKVIDGLLVMSEIEDQLINFTHGRKLRKGEEAPQSHRAKTTREYIELLNEGVGSIAGGLSDRVSALYSTLCELVHSYLSVLVFADVSEDGSRVKLRTMPDAEAIADLAETHGSLFQPIFQLSLNPCLVTLKLLNAFSLSSVHTRVMDEVELEMPGWRKIEEKLKKASAQKP